MLNIIRLLRDREARSKDRGQELKLTLKTKYSKFQDLLEHNNAVLMLIADMEEKLSAEYLFDRQYVNATVESMSKGVLGIIDSLNEISRGKYKELYARYEIINKKIEKTLSPGKEIPVSDFVIPLKNISGDMTDIAGGKIAHLGEVKSGLGLPVPDGFSITAYAFKRFLDHNSLAEKINARLHQLDTGNMEEISRFCREMQDVIAGSEIPSELSDDIKTAIENLKATPGKSPLMVSVRSSANYEDGDVSFAGQYATFLNVPEELIAYKYKEVLASIFRPRVVFYYKTKGFSETEMVMSVGVMRMIDSRAAGVLYTRDPNDPDSDKIIINAAWGLGETVVTGAEPPQSYLISRDKKGTTEKKLSDQHTMLVCTAGGGIAEAPVPEGMRNAPCLSDVQIKALSEHAFALEAHYGKPQDIEWAIDKDNRIHILQSRPLKTLKTMGSLVKIPRRLEQYNILIDRGLIASKGIGHGRAFVLRDRADLKSFPEGWVLVAGNMEVDFVVVMKKVAAIVIDTGSITCHTASLAREYEVPTIVDTATATSIIKHGQEITVDAVHCNVYEGRVEEILKFTVQTSSFRDTHVFKTLERIFKLISPLNLVSPEGENFRPECCMTFHDITRFSHEKAMSEMFSLGTEHDINECPAVQLKAGIPVDAHLIDLGGGLRENISKAAPQDILSVPFSVFLKGMMAMRWPGPPPADVKGFLGMIAHTASIPEEELRETGGHSYAFLSRTYMNFSIKLGYHFSMVEAFAGENLNDNYIKFHFKGGGATTDRRMRRLRLITVILKKMDFLVDVRDDVLDAVLHKFKQADIEKRLEVMGKLTAYTKQLDMAMYNDAVTDLFTEDFIREHINL